MSVRPGVTVTQRSTPPPRSAPTDTGLWHVVGLTDTGPLTPLLVTSMADFERKFGPRVSYSILYDAVDTYFREGGSRAYISRVVGPAATTGTRNLLDAGAAVSLVASALGPGASSANISVGVRAGVGGGNFVVFVVVGGVEVETSPDLADNNAAVLWSQTSQYIRLALGASANDPNVAAAAALSAGSDDRTNIVDTQRFAALDRLTADLGPGQVSMPGTTTSTVHGALLTHAKNRRRTAILDAPDTPTQATLVTAASSARNGDQRYGGMFAPWLVAPGVVTGTIRTVPPSALVAGKIAKNEAAGFGAGDPAAGDLGQAEFISGLSQLPWDDTTRQTLNGAGINVIRPMFGGFRIYGWRSLVDAVADPDWAGLNNSRLFGSISARAAAIAEGFVFDKIDGQGKKTSEFGGVLKGLLMDYYTNGDLYGATPQEAFFVDVGPQVNTPATLALNELHAVLNVKFSPFAEWVQIEIVKRPISEGVV